MKAVQLTDYGYENLKVNGDVPNPQLKEGQILVQLHASSINPFDTFIIKGYMKDAKPLDLPIIPGNDFSGKVIGVGEGVEGITVGEEVYGSAIIFGGGSGAFAEVAVVDKTRFARKPVKTDFIQAASLPLVGSSAIQALDDTIKLAKGQKILIHGGAGGIGSIAIQLAKYRGAYVATTVSGEDREFVKSLGADQVIDYKTEKFEEILKDFDAVYDTVGSSVMESSFKVLKVGGILASMKGQPDEKLSQEYKVKAVAVNTSINADKLTRLAELVDGGIIHPQVDKIFGIDQTGEAFEYKEKNHPNGKVVIKMR